jgi:hypothetical protein
MNGRDNAMAPPSVPHEGFPVALKASNGPSLTTARSFRPSVHRRSPATTYPSDATETGRHHAVRFAFHHRRLQQNTVLHSEKPASRRHETPRIQHGGISRETTADRLGFEWRAHEKGDANRSAHVERQFDHIEGNFLAGREFADWNDLNQQARTWCDKVNATYKRHLHASPRELFATERLHLRPLPAWVPEVYLLHQRIVDSEGYVRVNRTRYSAPWLFIGRQLEVRETKDRIDLYQGPRLVATHKRFPEPTDQRITLPEHRPPRGQGAHARRALEPEKATLVKLHPEMARYVQLLEHRHRTVRDLRRLLRLTQEYPREPLLAAVRVAAHYGLDDLERLERIILRHVAQEFFLLPPDVAPAETDRPNAEGCDRNPTSPTPADPPLPEATRHDDSQAEDDSHATPEDQPEDNPNTKDGDD